MERLLQWVAYTPGPERRRRARGLAPPRDHRLRAAPGDDALRRARPRGPAPRALLRARGGPAHGRCCATHEPKLALRVASRTCALSSTPSSGAPRSWSSPNEDLPTPHWGEVRVRLAVAGVNPTDWKARAGATAAEMPAPEVVPGQDGAGVVDEVGKGVYDLKAGDRVWVYLASARAALTAPLPGLLVVPAERAVRLPSGASYDVGCEPRRAGDDGPPRPHRARGRPPPAVAGRPGGPGRAGHRWRRSGRSCRDPARGLGRRDGG